jgi:hypothetical protein
MKSRHLIDTSSLMLGIIFSSIGLGYFIYGKKQADAVTRYCGITLRVYPDLIEDDFAVLVVAIVLLAPPKFIKL